MNFKSTLLFILTLCISKLVALEPNRPELDLPFLDKKLVIAHYMTAQIHAEIGSTNQSSDLKYYDRNGPYAHIGGWSQVAPMDLFIYKRDERSLEEAVELEIVKALAVGIDGFQFYYINHGHPGFMDRYNTIIKTFFKVAEKKFPDFKLTLCFSLAQSEDPEEGEAKEVAQWAKNINDILSVTRTSNNWLKTPDGRYIFYTWCPDGIAGVTGGQHWRLQENPQWVRDVAIALEKVAKACNIKIGWVYHMRFWDSSKFDEFYTELMKYFPAFWNWTDGLKNIEAVKKCAIIAKQNQRAFSITVYPSYYTSKIYSRQGSYERIWQEKIVQKLKPHEFVRHKQAMQVSTTYTKYLELAVEVDTPFISYATFNDYPEGHHIAPEINHNFVPAVLLDYYKNKWQGKPEKTPESTSVLYKKYRHDVTPTDFNIEVKVKSGEEFLAYDDSIDIVSIVKEPAQLFVNGSYVADLQPGIQTIKLNSQPGPVEVSVLRNNEAFIHFLAPEWTTDKPYRTDRMTYMYSSRFQEYFEKIYGKGIIAPVSNEYADPNYVAIKLGVVENEEVPVTAEISTVQTDTNPPQNNEAHKAYENNSTKPSNKAPKKEETNTEDSYWDKAMKYIEELF